MVEKFKNPHEGKEELLREIAKKVNALLDPIVQSTFDLERRKRDCLLKDADFNEAVQLIGEKAREKAENLGLKIEDFDQIIAKDVHEEYLKSKEAKKKTEKKMEETRLSKTLPYDIVEKIREIDKDGRLEKEITRIYDFAKKVPNWNLFIFLLNGYLKDDPFFWDALREESESEK